MGKPIIIALVITAGLALASVYWALEQRLQQLEQDNTQLPLLQTRLTQLEQQLEQKQIETKGYIEKQLQSLEVDLISAIKNNSQSDSLMTRQLTSSYQLVTKLVQDLQVLTAQHDKLIQQIDDSRQLAKDLIAQHAEYTQSVIKDMMAHAEAKWALLDELLQPGSVISYSGALNENTRKKLRVAGWLVCDGRTYQAQDYPELYARIKNVYGGKASKTFRVPDFRGVFLRGLDAGRGLDPKRRLGHYQTDQNKRHQHKASMDKAGAHQHSGYMSGAPQGSTDLWYTPGGERLAIPNTYITPPRLQFSTDNAGAHRHQLHINASGGHEARPKNQAVVYLIKY